MFQKQVDMKYRKAVRLVGLCSVWYGVSSVMGVVGKMILNEFSYPITVTMVQLVSLIVFLLPFMKNLSDKPPLFPVNLAKIFWLQMLLPLALGKFISSAFSHVSIWKVPVSYAHTVKATLPLFTVFLSRVVLREKQSYKIYLSLIPIMCGVLIASVTEISFDLAGFVSALLSTIAIALQNIYSKKMLKEHPLHHFTLLFTLATIATTLFLPLWLYWDLTGIINDVTVSRGGTRLVMLLLLDGACYFCQNVVAFTVMAMVSPLSYSVANCTKRIAIISASLLVLANPVSTYNVLGMLVAILGVLCYNKAKYDQYSQSGLLLPTIQSRVNNFSKHSIHSNDGVYSNGVVLPLGHLSTESLVMRSHSDHKNVINI